MLNTSAILAYSSLTLVKPWMRPVGLPWASWVWKMSLGLGYSAGPGSGGDGGGSGGAVGSEPSWPGLVGWLWPFCSSSGAPVTAAVATVASPIRGLLASPFSMGFSLTLVVLVLEPWLCASLAGAQRNCPCCRGEHRGQVAAAAAELMMRVAR